MIQSLRHLPTLAPYFLSSIPFPASPPFPPCFLQVELLEAQLLKPLSVAHNEKSLRESNFLGVTIRNQYPKGALFVSESFQGQFTTLHL